MKASWLTLLLALLAGCASAPQNANLSCGDAGPNTLYFPAGTFEQQDGTSRSKAKFDPETDVDGVSRDWYSQHLHRMQQPSLSCGPQLADESYRFLLLPISPGSVSVRISRFNRSYSLAATILDGDGNFNPGNIRKQIDRSLSGEEWRRAKASLLQFDFWNIPTVKPPTRGDLIIIQADGDEWIIEGNDGRYHVVDRHNGEDGTDNVGTLFLDLAGLRMTWDGVE